MHLEFGDVPYEHHPRISVSSACLHVAKFYV